MKKSLEEAKDAYKLTSGTLEGKVGLIYPSDYGYATSNRTCLSMVMSASWSKTNCSSNDWLYKGSESQWTITPVGGVLLMFSLWPAVVS